MGPDDRPLEADQSRLLDVRNVAKRFTSGRGPRREEFDALFDVSLTVGAGECLGVVGESGSGKTTLARILSGLIAADAGGAYFEGAELSPQAFEQSRQLRRRIQIVFQNPFQALNPRRAIAHSLTLPLRNFHGLSGDAARARAIELLAQVELRAEVLVRYPSELSGGQCQRIALARALAAEPRVLVLDEAVASVDALTAVRLVDLLKALRAQHGLAFVFISHDLGLVAALADRMAVLERGRLVELGTTDEVYHAPRHPYTKRLIEASEAVVFDTDVKAVAGVGFA
jgi:peptide/nickel transport system ATP-binding protein